ncbi:MAG: hypothetical protein QOJ38_116 [Solirubrobacterales bacterium]|nr:hypothetical protein [Solirubrobacterales bacterium]
MRVLQALWDGGGNVGPQLAIGRRLVERGHDVRILGHACQRPRVEAIGARFVPYRHAPDGDASSPETDLIRDWEARTPIGAFARMRDRVMFGPSLRFARDVLAEIEREPADVVAWDFMLLGAGVAAERAGVPSAMLVHTVYPLPLEGVPPFGQGLMPAQGPLGRARDAVLARAFVRAFKPGLKALNATRRELGLEPAAGPFEHLDRVDVALVLTSERFDFPDPGQLPAHVRYTGPVLGSAPAGGWESPWDADDPRPLVLVSFSTTFQDQRALAERVIAALGTLPVRALLTVGPSLDIEGIPLPANVEARDFVPHAAVLGQASLVVTHAGLGTVHAALAAGVPLVCLPDGRDQNDNAARVVAAGAGLRLPKRASAARLAKTIAAALADPQLAEAAAQMSRSLATADGAASAVAELEALAG